MRPKILLVEDNVNLVELIRYNLDKEGFDVVSTPDGEEALVLAEEERPDVVVLDWMMPNLSGIEVCRRLKMRPETRNIPIILLSARAEEVDRVRGLETGADDYVIKPFNPSEVVARVEAVLRRTKSSAEVAHLRPLRTYCLTIYPDEFYVEITVRGQISTPVLTTTEFKLLTYLARNPRKVCSREELLDACLPEGDSLDRTVDSHMSKLRKKLEHAGLKGVPESIRGLGYRLGDNK